MTTTLKRQLSEDDKQRVIEIHGRRCFATGHEIGEDSPLHFDHIRAYTTSHYTELDNIAPMCEAHNKAKGTLALEDFRVKLRLQEFFRGGDSLTLKDLLRYLKESGDIGGFGDVVSVTVEGDKVRLESGSSSESLALYECPTTGWQYFYATLNVSLLDSDDDDDQKMGLQPRYLIQDKVFELFRHFQRHPVLQPSVGRVHNDRLLLFDGQHKVASLLWTGRRDFECKIYLAPEVRLLNETNIAAHDTFSQTRFYSSIMVMKLGTEFGADFEAYKKIEDGTVKSEAGFMDYLERDTERALTRADRNRRFRSFLYNSVLETEDCKIAQFVSNSNRSTDEKPITIDMLSKSLFGCFLSSFPAVDNMATAAYKRDHEVGNLVSLMNSLYDLALCSWDPKAGANDETQRRLVRLFRSKSIMAWSELLRDAVCGKLELIDAEDRDRPLYRELSDTDLQRIHHIVERLVGWNLWNSPPDSEADRILADNKSVVKEWFRGHGLTTGYLMGAAE